MLMSLVAAGLYRDGKKVKAVSLDEPIDCRGKSEFVWIGLHKPFQEELKKLEASYGLHPLAIVFVMARTAHLEVDAI